jgi:hypothetical protein
MKLSHISDGSVFIIFLFTYRTPIVHLNSLSFVLNWSHELVVVIKVTVNLTSLGWLR